MSCDARTWEVPATSMSSSRATPRTVPPSRRLTARGMPACRSHSLTVRSAEPAHVQAMVSQDHRATVVSVVCRR